MQRAALLVAAALALAACGEEAPAGTPTPAPATGSPASPSPEGPPAGCDDETQGGAEFHITQMDSEFQPDCLIVTPGQGPSIENMGGFLHNFSIRGTGIDVDIASGDIGRFEAILLDPGEYEFFCKYHESLGMVGTLIVVEA